MKRFLNSMFVLVLIVLPVLHLEVDGKEHIADSAEYNAILRELKEIKAIQDSTYQQRLRAAEKRMQEAEFRRGNNQDYELSEYGVMSNIEKNTKPSFICDDVNAIGVAALIVAFASLIVAGVTLNAQKKTEENTRLAEKHTKRAPISVQKGKLEDLPRHFYRNLVCTCSQIFLFNDKANRDSSGRRICYPSESNVLKLQTLPDDIILHIDVENEKVYKSMHELRLLFRNYSQEVTIAAEHISRANITDESLFQDFDNLLFKPMFLTKKTFDFELALEGKTGKDSEALLFNRDRITMIREHFSKFRENALILLDKTRLDYLNRLMQNEFHELMDLDHKGAINRSMKAFFYESDDAEKEILVKMHKKVIVLDDTDMFTKNICNIGSEESLYETFRNSVKGFEYKAKPDSEVAVKIEGLYKILKPYFEFLEDDVWEFKTIFYYMLAIDTAIETDKIGMVNY